MDFLGRITGRSKKDSSPKLLDDASTAEHRMEPTDKSDSLGNETSARSLADRVRGLATARRSVAAPSGSSDDTPRDSLIPTQNSKASIDSRTHVDTEQSFVEACRRKLDKSKPLKERIATVKSITSELQKYSIGTCMATLAMIEDLGFEDAPLEARNTCYAFIEAASLHSGLDPEERIKLFSIIRIPTTPNTSKFQYRALRALLRDGRAAQPFELELCNFLADQLRHVFDATLDARSAFKKSRARRSKEPIAEEEALEELLSLIEGVASWNPDMLSGEQLGSVVDRLTSVANKTTVQKDLNQVASIFAVVTKSNPIPREHFKACIEVLSGIACTADLKAEKSSWLAFRNLLTSGDQSRTLYALLDILQECYGDRQSVAVRGALLTIKQLLEADGEGGLPIVPFQTLLEALPAVSSISSRLRMDCLQVLVSCLKEPNLAQRLLAADWSGLNQIIYGQRGPGEPHEDTSIFRYTLGTSSPLHSLLVSGQLREPSSHKGIQQEQIQLASLLEANWADLENVKRGITLGLSLYVGSHLDDSMMDLAIEHMVAEQLVFPPDENWRPHLELLLELCAFDATKSVKARCRVLDAVAETLKTTKDNPKNLAESRELVLKITRSLSGSRDMVISNTVAYLGANYALDMDMDLFGAVLAFILQMVGLEDQGFVQSPTLTTPSGNHAATCLVWLFLQCLPRSAIKSKKVYEALISVASNKALPTDARLTVMKLLTRIRCNLEYGLKVVSIPDSLGLAATLYRTEASSQGRMSVYGLSGRSSIIGESPGRVGRTSGVDHSRPTRSRSTTRSGGPRDRSIKAIPPLWMYPGSKGLPLDPPPDFSKSIFVHNVHGDEKEGQDVAFLELDSWLDIMLDTLQKGGDWEIYSYILVHLPSQLHNIALFAERAKFVQALHRIILVQLRTGNLHEPPTSTGVKKGDVAVCLYHSLTVLVVYQEHLDREQLDETVRIFLTGISMWERASKCCIHALALCAHEVPSNLRRSLLAIIQKLSQIITQSHLAIDILEFLAGLVRLPEAYQIAGFDGQDFLRTIFGICISHIHHAREQREKEDGNSLSRLSSTPARLSGFSNRSVTASDGSQVDEVHKDLPEYVFNLAYHVMTIWFLAIDLRERSKHVGWIVKNLTWKDELGNDSMEEQSQVTLDMIHRTAYNDLGETKANEHFLDVNGPITKETWLYGMSVITLETVGATGLTQITKRQASGTTHAMYQQYTAQLPPHHVTMPSARSSGGADVTTKVLPQHVLLQLGFTIAPVPIPLQPILLPEDDTIQRAISSFDRMDTVDGHKAGIVYVSAGQMTETDILANTSGPKAYDYFLAGLGTRIRLRDAAFNTQGLDRTADMDGTHTYAWRDRVSEIVFHVATMMPTNTDDDPQCISKKRHIGNDYVNIIYNHSGLPFNFDTFSSQFNHVNIVITPEVVARRQTRLPGASSKDQILEEPDGKDLVGTEPSVYFTVQTVCSPSYPQLSPAATPKILSAKALPGFVRQLALNSSVFSLVWSNRAGGQNFTSWRNRLKAIMKLRQRYANTGVSANVSYPGMGTSSDRGGAPSYIDGDEWHGDYTMAGLAERDLLYSADFTRWN